jgi:hypothetical protein
VSRTEPEQLKAAIERQLAAEGAPVEVEVEVKRETGGGERQEVRVRVVKEAPGAADAGAR